MKSISQTVQKLSSGNKDRHTDTQTEMCKTFTYPLLQEVIRMSCKNSNHFIISIIKNHKIAKHEQIRNI